MNNPSSPSWGNKPLGKLISLIQNGTTAQQNMDRVGFPVSRIQTVQNNKVDPGKVRFINDENIANQYRYKNGDILYSHINSFELVGKVAVYEGIPEFLVHGMNLLLIRTNQNLCDSKYLFWFLQSPQARTETAPWIKRAIGQASINQTNLQKINVPLPLPDQPEKSIMFQRQIVARIEALLSEVREMQEINQTIQKDVGRLMDAVYEEAYPYQHGYIPVGWEIKTFSDVCQINPRRPQIRREANTATSFVPMAAVDENTGSIVDLQVKPYSEVRTGFTYFEENDVLFAKITPSMQNGKAAIARGLIDGFGFGSTEFHVFKANHGILPEWIYHYIRRTHFRKEAMQRFRGAAGQQRVPQEFLERHIIPVPFPNDPEKSITTQKRLVAYFETMKKETFEMQDIARQDSIHLEQLEKSILAQAFRGEL